MSILTTTDEYRILGFLMKNYHTQWGADFILNLYKSLERVETIETLRDFVAVFDGMRAAELQNSIPTHENSRSILSTKKNQLSSKSKKRPLDTVDFVDMTEPIEKRTKTSNVSSPSSLVEKKTYTRSHALSDEKIKDLIKKCHALHSDPRFRSHDTFTGSSDMVELWRLEEAFKYYFTDLEQVSGDLKWDRGTTYISGSYKLGCENMRNKIKAALNHYASKMASRKTTKNPPRLRLYFGCLDTYLFHTRKKTNVTNVSTVLDRYKTLFTSVDGTCLPPLVWVYDAKQTKWMKVEVSFDKWWPQEVEDADD